MPGLQVAANSEKKQKIRPKACVLGLVCAVAFFFSGCQRYYGPIFQPPGTIFQQRYIAVQHDPFPSDVFGPKIEGGRPLGYTKGLAEPAASQFSIRGR